MAPTYGAGAAGGAPVLVPIPPARGGGGKKSGTYVWRLLARSG